MTAGLHPTVGIDAGKRNFPSKSSLKLSDLTTPRLLTPITTYEKIFLLIMSLDDGNGDPESFPLLLCLLIGLFDPRDRSAASANS